MSGTLSKLVESLLSFELPSPSADNPEPACPSCGSDTSAPASYVLAPEDGTRLLAMSCSRRGAPDARLFADKPQEPASMTPPANPLLDPWTGPFGGVPAFDRMKVEDFEPALVQAMAQHLKEIAAIANTAATPTFANVFEALEDSGRALRAVLAYYGVASSSMNTPAMMKVKERVDPLLAAHWDAIVQNEKLFARIQAAFASPETEKLSPEQRRVAWLRTRSFVRAGAKLDPAAKKRVAAINAELASLTTAFDNNLLADEQVPVVITAEEFNSLPASVQQMAAPAKDAPGVYHLANNRSVFEPFLESCPRRDLRERVWRAFVDRGDRGGATDNNALIPKILALRAEKAALLGYATYAHWKLEDAVAKTPERAMKLMEDFWSPAVAAVKADVAEMQKIVDADKGGFKLQPWDYRYYAEKLRKAKYDIDVKEVRSYLQLEKLREGMFWAAGKLYGYGFREITGLPVFDKDVRVFEVTRGGKHAGLLYFDPYARDHKSSGAWMGSYREQERFRGDVSPIVSVNANFGKPKPGEPALMSWDDAVTLFHEFGHALHGLSSSVAYPYVSGTDVPGDYVEFPSQINERWLLTPEIMERFVVHHETGAPMPKALVDRIVKARTFNQGFLTLEYLAGALIDMKLHMANKADVDADRYEREELARMGMPAEVVMRHRLPQFAHVFAGDGYAAGYYSYMWANVLTADGYEAFLEAGSPYDPATAERYFSTCLSKGNSADPLEQFRAFRGRDPKIGALLRDLGFPVPPGEEPAR